MTHENGTETDGLVPVGPGDGGDADNPTRIGSRIAELRKIHGVTQRALSVRAAVSYSLLRKVERGERAASHSFVAAVARAMSVNITDLTEQPHHTRPANPSSEQAGVPALRQALVEGDDPQLDTDPRAVEDLRADVARIKEWDRRTRHAEAVQALPDLLRHLHHAARAHPEDPAVHELLATAYSYTMIALYRLGHLDLCHLADERARAAAARGADPVRGSVAEWNHALVLLFDGSYNAGLRSLDRSLGLLEPVPETPATSAVRGAVHLRAAILAARTADADLADTHLREARAMVVDGQDEANHYGTKFGATNVDIHGVAVPVELADGTTAVTRAATVQLPEHTAPSRSGHYWIDLSRGWLLHGDRRRSLECLQTARRIAPQLTRYHPQVHETVQSLAASDARSTNSLSHFAAWCGIRR
ncbi:helix-turn-helix domain-containing protein [Saccharopolyspora gloriosae]|uniref:Transcriptional regulator with XRE-family HTH domain n=1 Tax=Saccharopolyspora gloriosae TaxID=455344 RepID=A0A840NIU3_9PSEU|nr:helix-turn-helix transcriptional regulator [Saccharopolyspora gloriosae]MBB5069209.1 transcriptional regulator with XRE-family HTH domain [Saccharopolyspora gloriosae]